MRHRDLEQGRHVCVIGQNTLAVRYLLQILARDPALSPAILGDLTTQESPASRLPASLPASTLPVFLIDRCGLIVPAAELLRRLKHRFPDGRYIVLDREESRDELVLLVSSGFHGFLPHWAVDHDLLPAVHAVSDGRLWMPADVLHSCAQGGWRLPRSRPLRDRTLRDAVTPRENQILELIKQRLSNKEIAEVLQIQVSTVKFHLSNIFSKRQINNRRDLAGEVPLLDGWKDFVSARDSSRSDKLDS